MYQPKKSTILHEEMLTLMCENPSMTQKDVAAFFGISAVTAGYIANSDIFQARLAERREKLLSVPLALREKIQAVADAACDRVMEQVVSATASPEFALSAADKMLTKLGYGVSRGAAVQLVQNNFTQNNKTVSVSREMLAGARAVLDAKTRGGTSLPAALSATEDKEPCPPLLITTRRSSAGIYEACPQD